MSTHWERIQACPTYALKMKELNKIFQEGQERARADFAEIEARYPPGAARRRAMIRAGFVDGRVK